MNCSSASTQQPTYEQASAPKEAIVNLHTKMLKESNAPTGFTGQKESRQNASLDSRLWPSRHLHFTAVPTATGGNPQICLRAAASAECLWRAQL